MPQKQAPSLSAIGLLSSVIYSRNSRDHFTLLAVLVGFYRLVRGRYNLSRGSGALLSLFAGITLERLLLFPAGVLRRSPRAAPGKFVRLSTGHTHYVLEGPSTGRVVVLIHGFCGEMSDLRLLAAKFVAEGRQVLRLDNVGRGFSACPGLHVPHTPELFVQQIHELLSELGLLPAADGNDTIDVAACRAEARSTHGYVGTGHG